MNDLPDLNTSRALDRSDPLTGFRDLFFHSNENMIYLDGNSLGRMPLSAVNRIEELMTVQWGERLIRSWNERWIDLSQAVCSKIADLLGAVQDEIHVGDSTSINLYKLAFAVLKIQRGRTRIVTDSLNFPTDLYILQGLIAEHFPHHQLEIVESNDNISVSTEQIADALDEKTALLSLSHVTFKSASLYDMARISRLAREKGVMVIWDLSHSAGSVPVHLNGNVADMAVGCTYKYLNGGPGAPAYLYIRKELQEKLTNPVWGWFGHEKPFEFRREYIPSVSVNRFATGTPHVLSLVPVETGVDILLAAGVENLRKKSVAQSEFLIKLIKLYLEPLGFKLGSPEDPLKRGSHISIRHPEGYRINMAMINPPENEIKVIPDFRPPDNIRLGIAPLYISFEDIWHAVNRIENIVKKREYETFCMETKGVT